MSLPAPIPALSAMPDPRSTSERVNALLRRENQRRPLDGKIFGFKADGSDESDRMAAAIAAAIGENCSLILPAGTIGIDASLTVDDMVDIQGNGWGTIIKPLSNDVSSLFNITGSYVSLRHLRIDGSAIATPTYTAIKVNSSGQVRLDDMWLKGGANGMVFPQGNACGFYRLRIEDFDICVQSGGVAGVFPGDTTWRDIVLIPTDHTGYAWIIDGNTNAQRVHHMVGIGGLTNIYIRGTGGDIRPDGIELLDGCNFTQTDGPVIKIKKAQNVLIGDACVIGASVTECGIEIDADADADVDGVLIAGAEIRANFKEGIRWTGGANVSIRSSWVYANSDGNATAGIANCSNVYVGAGAVGKFEMVGVMAGASNGGYVYANVAGAAKYAVELASGALTDATNFPGSVLIAACDLRGCNVGSISDASVPTGLAKHISANLTQDGATAWTPELKFGGTDTGITYSVQSGVYRQFGDSIYVNAHIVLTSKGSATGAATIDGLPVACSTAFTGGAIDFPYYQSVADFLSPQGYVGTGETTMHLTNADATGHAAMDDTNFTDSSEFYLSGWYPL